MACANVALYRDGEVHDLVEGWSLRNKTEAALRAIAGAKSRAGDEADAWLLAKERAHRCDAGCDRSAYKITRAALVSRVTRQWRILWIGLLIPVPVVVRVWVATARGTWTGIYVCKDPDTIQELVEDAGADADGEGD